ncbi:MAG: hypothetical protein JXR07_20530 [Reichenbachiella sp.]
MTDFLQSILETFKERLKSPFIGSFIISFLGFNWRPILYVFYSSDDMSKKLQCYTDFLMPQNYWFLYPFIFSTLYTLTSHWFFLVFEFLTKFVVGLRLDQQTTRVIDDNVRKLKQVSSEKELEKAKSENKELAELNSLLAKQKEEILTLKNSLDEAYEQTELIKNLNKEEKDEVDYDKLANPDYNFKQAITTKPPGFSEFPKSLHDIFVGNWNITIQAVDRGISKIFTVELSQGVYHFIIENENGPGYLKMAATGVKLIEETSSLEFVIAPGFLEKKPERFFLVIQHSNKLIGLVNGFHKVTLSKLFEEKVSE